MEPKLFGIGSESYVVGSMEFYLAYALSRKILLTLDAGHFHPTETIADKISSLLIYLDQLFLHVSRGVRWDSDHVVTFNDDLQAIAQEIVRNDALERIHIGLDYFDASINRVAAWTIGARNTLRALADGFARATGNAETVSKWKVISPAVWHYRRNSNPCPSVPCGITTAYRKMSLWEWTL